MVVLELIDELGPTRRTRCGPVHHHHRDPLRVVGLGHQNTFVEAELAKDLHISGEERRGLEIPDRRALERSRERHGGLELERDGLTVYLDRVSLVERVQLEGAVKLAVEQPATRIVDPQECRHRNLQSRRNAPYVCHVAALLERSAHRRHQGSAEAGAPVAVPETAHLEGCGRLEALQRMLCPEELR
jgi:hypothetical protein